jgi:hypothetical protein
VESSGRTARVGRTGLLLTVAVLAFAAGLAMRGWSGESGALAPQVAKPVDGVSVSPGIRLVRADPGALHRQANRPRRPPGGAPAGAAPRLLIRRPVPVGSRRRPSSHPPSGAADRGSFDLSSPPSPQANQFDSEK